MSVARADCEATWDKAAKHFDEHPSTFEELLKLRQVTPEELYNQFGKSKKVDQLDFLHALVGLSALALLELETRFEERTACQSKTSPSPTPEPLSSSTKTWTDLDSMS